MNDIFYICSITDLSVIWSDVHVSISGGVWCQNISKSGAQGGGGLGDERRNGGLPTRAALQLQSKWYNLVEITFRSKSF